MEALHHPTEQPEPPEFFPTIIVDKDIGEQVSDLDINIPRLVDELTKGGMTPRQIAETTITFDANRDIAHGQEAVGRVASNGTDVIINPTDYFDQSRRYHRAAYNPDEPELFTKDYPAGRISRLLRHELEHRIVVTEGGMPEEEHHRKVTHRKIVATTLLPAFVGAPLAIFTKETYLPSHSLAEYIGTFIVAAGASVATGFLAPRRIINKSYKESPEENRARDTETSAHSRGLVTVQLKMPDLPPSEISEQ